MINKRFILVGFGRDPRDVQGTASLLLTSICLSTRLSLCMFVCLFICLSLPFDLPTYLNIHNSIQSFAVKFHKPISRMGFST